MMPRFEDLVNVEQVCSINVEVADGYLVPVTAYGEVILNLVDKRGKDFTVRLLGVFYVPGLTQRLFSIPKFNKFGNTANVKNGFMHLSFKGKVVNTPLLKTPKAFFQANMAKSISVPHTNDKIGHYKSIPLETLHNRLGHTRANTIIYTSQNRCWADVITTMNAEKYCEPCQIVTTRAHNRCKISPSNPMERGHTIYMDILPPIPGL